MDRLLEVSWSSQDLYSTTSGVEALEATGADKQQLGRMLKERSVPERHGQISGITLYTRTN